jgi:hypothetical protein
MSVAWALRMRSGIDSDCRTTPDESGYPRTPGGWDPLARVGGSVSSVTTNATVEAADPGGLHTVVRLKVSEVESDPVAPGWMGWQTLEGNQASFCGSQTSEPQ